jgi:hypothetical protein
VLCMEPDHVDIVRARWGHTKVPIGLLGDWHPGRPRRTIPDPFGGDLTVFADSFECIDRCLGSLAHTLPSGRKSPARLGDVPACAASSSTGGMDR